MMWAAVRVQNSFEAGGVQGRVQIDGVRYLVEKECEGVGLNSCKTP